MQILLNLVGNAFDAAPDDSIVELTVEPDPTHQQVVLTISNPFRDEGLSDPKRIFEPFYTTKSKGTGLGLAIVRRLVEAHAGTIRAKSESGVTRFVVELPVDNAD